MPLFAASRPLLILKAVFLDLFTVLLLAVAAAPLLAAKEAEFEVHSLSFEGFVRTQQSWAASYLGLNKLPVRLSFSELEALRVKLLTTGVFSTVTLALAPLPFSNFRQPGINVNFRQPGINAGINDFRQPGINAASQVHLTLRCTEKWTAIPVLRGQFGGGTPLLVLGGYDTHSLGSLWTLGAELRRYGSAPVGGVAYAKAPRWLQGKHSLGLELWRENRLRSIYPRQPQEGQASPDAVGVLDLRYSRARSYFLWPLALSGLSSHRSRDWQWGVDAVLLHTLAADIRSSQPAAAAAVYQRVILPPPTPWAAQVFATLVYDDITIAHPHYEGLRFAAKVGALREDQTRMAWELEAFAYRVWGSSTNLALHGFMSSTQSSSLLAQTYLGGFDSLRGLPDGAIFGSQASYGNAELRQLVARLPYLWCQAVFFIDVGAAAADYAGLTKDPRASFGAGLRLDVPQVHRLMVRIDAAHSLLGPRSFGFALGLNHLFQPYKPL